MTDHPATASVQHITGYTYGSSNSARSPLDLDDLKPLKDALGWTDTDEHYLRLAGPVLAEHAEEMVDAWREALSEHPQLAIFSA